MRQELDLHRSSLLTKIITQHYLRLYHVIITGTKEWGELGHWCELGQNFSESSPLLLLVKGDWCEIGQKFSASGSLRLLVNAYLTTIAKVMIH